jgi:hypothetical protein
LNTKEGGEGGREGGREGRRMRLRRGGREGGRGGTYIIDDVDAHAALHGVVPELLGVITWRKGKIGWVGDGGREGREGRREGGREGGRRTEG